MARDSVMRFDADDVVFVAVSLLLVLACHTECFADGQDYPRSTSVLIVTTSFIQAVGFGMNCDDGRGESYNSGIVRTLPTRDDVPTRTCRDVISVSNTRNTIRLHSFFLFSSPSRRRTSYDTKHFTISHAMIMPCHATE
jgi:hypothetical protein